MWGSNDKGKDKPELANAEKAVAQASKASAKSARTAKPARAAASVDTLVGKGTHIKGDLYFAGGLHIDGKVSGRVIAENDGTSVVSISDSGVVDGSIRAPFVVVNGLAEGDVHASERISLSPTARVVGNVYYRLIELPAGATINGQMFYDDGSQKIAALPSGTEYEAVSDNVVAGDASGGKEKKQL